MRQIQVSEENIIPVLGSPTRPTLGSQLFLHFLTKRNKPFTKEKKSWLDHPPSRASFSPYKVWLTITITITITIIIVIIVTFVVVVVVIIFTS